MPGSILPTPALCLLRTLTLRQQEEYSIHPSTPPTAHSTAFSNTPLPREVAPPPFVIFGTARSILPAIPRRCLAIPALTPPCNFVLRHYKKCPILRAVFFSSPSSQGACSVAVFFFYRPCGSGSFGMKACPGDRVDSATVTLARPHVWAFVSLLGEVFASSVGGRAWRRGLQVSAVTLACSHVHVTASMQGQVFVSSVGGRARPRVVLEPVGSRPLFRGFGVQVVGVANLLFRATCDIRFDQAPQAIPGRV